MYGELRRIKEMFTSLRRDPYRGWEDFDFRKRLRQISLPRRITLAAVCIFFMIYFFISSFSSSPGPSLSELCLSDRMRHWNMLEMNSAISISDSKVLFVGNGYIGVGGDGELRLKGPSMRVLTQLTSLFPLIKAHIKGASSEAQTSFTDYRTGVVKNIQCYSVDDKCACITRTIYAHRSRSHLLVQEIRTTNPTDSAIALELSTKQSSKWTQGESVGNTFVNSRLLEVDGTRTMVVAICSFVPETIVVEGKREDSERFSCVFNYKLLKTGENDVEVRKRLGQMVVKEFADLMHIGGAVLDREHDEAWQSLNVVTFGISKSLAPDALNADVINNTRYALLSNVRAPLIENDVSVEEKQEAMSLLHRNDMCYTGHSTLLVPSRLWKSSKSVSELIQTVDVWLLTLEKRGCVNLLRSGAKGVAEAFALSLLASRFTRDHLEVEIDPGELHRDITLDGLTLSSEAKINIGVHLDSNNKPYFIISSSSQVYVCDAGCLNPPISVGHARVKVPVKTTRPLTPILYVSSSRQHLEQLRGTIHVIDVAEVPAHEQELIALHKHGHRLGGLPVIFWVMLGALVLIFHLFLFKLVYSEWKKTDSTPYNYYLRQRYMRNH